MGSLSVRSVSGDRFSIDIRGFGVEVDQPLSLGGTNMAPTPTELFVASLAACAAFYAHRYLVRHDLPSEPLRVQCSYDASDTSPHRVTRVRLSVVLPAPLSDKHRMVLSKVVDGCTVHNSLRNPPDVEVTLVEKADIHQTVLSG